MRGCAVIGQDWQLMASEEQIKAFRLNLIQVYYRSTIRLKAKQRFKETKRKQRFSY